MSDVLPTLTDTGIRGGPIDYYDRSRHTEVGRWSQLYGDPEQHTIPPRGALQHPIYRRELFLRFYEFHLRYRTHPGCVYFALPWLQEKYKLDAEQQLWLAFINGNTQNIVTSWIIFTACPDFKRGTGQELANFFTEHYRKLQFDTDRRYHKKDFLASVECYRKLTGGDQTGYFRGLVGNQEPKPAFDHVWKALRRDFYTFGRLSTFSYTEYLRLVGVDIECPTLFLRDMDGSRSHRNGLARVLGRDDLDWHKSTGFEGKYAPGQLDWLEREAEDLLYEARERTRSSPHVDPGHVHYHTLESAFCTFKSWFRPNRRYANCYADMMVNRIRYGETAWGKLKMVPFWKMRVDCLPRHLRMEDCPNDPGLVPAKQNYFRSTGRPIMMSRDWPEFDNPFDRKCWS